MSERDHYPAGVPCWVENLQPDPRAALDFYGPLFGWEFAGPGPMPGDPPGEYHVARIGDRDVAGIGSLPATAEAVAPAWATYVRVGSIEESAARAVSTGGTLLAGPRDVPPAGRMAVLADPTGAPIGLWEAGVREGAQLVNAPGAWAMSMLHTTDPARATAFYADVFGWQPEPFGPDGAQLTLCRRPGYVGGEPLQPVPRDVVAVMMPIGGDGGPSVVQPHWSVDFWVHDADSAAGYVAEHGGKVIEPPHDTPGFRTAVLADPSGAVFTVSRLVAGP